MDRVPNKGSPGLGALIQWSEHLPAQVELVLNGSSCRVLGSCTASAVTIMVSCNCAACATRPTADLFRNGGRVMSLNEWCLHTSLGGASFERLAVRQAGADYTVPLPAWLRAAALHMGGEALKRKQLSVFWWDSAPDGPVSTVPPPPCQRSLELAKRAATESCGAWRAATVVGFEPRTGLSTLKYHSDPKKQVSQVYLPLALIHFARLGPQLGTPPRNVAEGATPLPPVLLGPLEEPLAGGAAGMLLAPPAPVPTHPVLLQELQNQQQQMLQAIREQQLQQQMLQQMQEQLRLQELQVRLRHVPHMGITTASPQQEGQPQQQLQLRQQLQQQYLQQQLAQQQQQQQLLQLQQLHFPHLKSATSGSSGAGSMDISTGSNSEVGSWLFNRLPGPAAGVDSDDSSPVPPSSGAPSPVPEGAAFRGPGSLSGCASPISAPGSATGSLFGARQGMPAAPTTLLAASQPQSSASARQAALSRFGSSSADTGGAACASPLSGQAIAATAAAVTAVGVPAVASSTLTSFPTLSTSASPPVPSLGPGGGGGAVWSMDISGADGAWEPLRHLIDQASLPLPQPQPQLHSHLQPGPASGVKAQSGGAPLGGLSTLDPELEAMFQALESSPWSYPSLESVHHTATAPPAARADSFPAQPAADPGLSLDKAAAAASLQPPLRQGSAAPWWLVAAAAAAPAADFNSEVPPLASAIGSPPKRPRLDCGSGRASSSSAWYCDGGGGGGGGTASLPCSSSGIYRSSTNLSKLNNLHTGDAGDGRACASTSGDGHCDKGRGGGGGEGASMDCDWDPLLLDARLLDSLVPALLPTAVMAPAGMDV